MNKLALLYTLSAAALLLKEAGRGFRKSTGGVKAGPIKAQGSSLGPLKGGTKFSKKPSGGWNVSSPPAAAPATPAPAAAPPAENGEGGSVFKGLMKGLHKAHPLAAAAAAALAPHGTMKGKERGHAYAKALKHVLPSAAPHLAAGAAGAMMGGPAGGLAAAGASMLAPHIGHAVSKVREMMAPAPKTPMQEAVEALKEVAPHIIGPAAALGLHHMTRSKPRGNYADIEHYMPSGLR